MARKWKRRKHTRPPAGPTRGKYRQMWKAHIREMVSGEEDAQRGETIPAVDSGGYRTSLAA